MNSNKNAPVIHSLFFYVLLKYFCPWSLATTPWNNEAIVSKVWNLCLCFSLSPSCCLFLVFALFVGCTFFFYYSVVLLLSLAANSGSWERPNNGFEKVSESASWKRQPRPLSALYHQTTLALVSASFFTLTCNTTCHWYLSFLSYFVFLPSFLLFHLAHVLQTTPHTHTHPPPLPWVFRPFFGVTHSLLFYPLFYCLGPLFLFFCSLFIAFISFFVSPISLFWPQFYYLNVCHVSYFTFFFLALVSWYHAQNRQNYWY